MDVGWDEAYATACELLGDALVKATIVEKNHQRVLEQILKPQEASPEPSE